MMSMAQRRASGWPLTSSSPRPMTCWPRASPWRQSTSWPKVGAAAAPQPVCCPAGLPTGHAAGAAAFGGMTLPLATQEMMAATCLVRWPTLLLPTLLLLPP